MLNQLSLQIPDYSSLIDMLMEIYVLLSLCFFFRQWHSQIGLFIYQNFIKPHFYLSSDKTLKKGDSMV